MNKVLIVICIAGVSYVLVRLLAYQINGIANTNIKPFGFMIG